MAGFCEIKLAEPLDNSLLGEILPSRRVFIDYSREPFLEIKLSVLYSYYDRDSKRFKRSNKSSSLINKIDYLPNYYKQDIMTMSTEEANSLEEHRDNIVPFNEFKGETNKKLRTFNTTEHNARFVGTVNKTLGTQGTVYFDGLEPNLFNDINFTNLTTQVIKDKFEFIRLGSTKLVSTMDYPYYVNNYTINKMGTAMYPFNTLDEIQGTLLTIKNIKGVKVFFDKTDAQDRNFSLLDYVVNSDSYDTENFSDEGDGDAISVGEKKKIDKYLIKYNNGDFELEVDETLQYNTLTQKINYISEKQSLIKPFKEDQSINGGIHFDYNDRYKIDDEKILNYWTDSDGKIRLLPKDNIQYMTHGRDVSYEKSAGYDSIAFIGLMD